MKIVKLVLLCSVCFTAVKLVAQDNSPDSLDLFIQQQMEKFHIPGLAACVVKGEEIIWSKAFGYANIEEEKKMSSQSIMNIASISKTITATAIMQLWEQQKLKLDADVNTYLDFNIRNPNFPNTPITIKQLLTHTSSIADGSALKLAYECGDPTLELKEWIFQYFSESGIYYNREENFHPKAPDSLHQYSNLAFGLLGVIVEEVSGMPFHQYVRQNIFDRLGMSQTSYFLKDLPEEKMVTPYLYLGPLQQNLQPASKPVLPYFNPYCLYSFWNYPDGLVRTSVEDLAKFATAMMKEGSYGGQQVLQKETIDKMMSIQLSKQVNEDQDQGLSWFQSQSLFPAWYHGGADPGVSTRMYVNKEEDLAVIVFQNVNEDNTFYIVKKLYQYFK